MQLIFYSNTPSPRLNYAIQLLCDTLLGIKYQFTTDLDAFLNSKNLKVSYGIEFQRDDVFTIPAHHLLFEFQVNDTEIPISEQGENLILFPKSGGDMPFDLLSAIFYMATRYEEYLPQKRDEFERILPESSLAFKNDFLKYPICHIWAEKFQTALVHKFGEIPFHKNVFKHILSVDIDVVFAFQGRSLFHRISASIKDVLYFDFSRLNYRLKTLKGKKKDPFDALPFLLNLKSKFNFELLFFALVGNYGGFDNALNSRNSQVSSYLNDLQKHGSVGLHPSLKAQKVVELLSEEKQNLEQILNKSISKSRQHFITLQFPKTYSSLVKNGIMADFSMAYPQLPGFRSGFCKPYPWFDLDKNEATNFEIHPFPIMDATFNYYLHCTADEALSQMLLFAKQVKKYNGLLYSVWHNNAFSDMDDWKNWGDLLPSFLMKLEELQHEK